MTKHCCAEAFMSPDKSNKLFPIKIVQGSEQLHHTTRNYGEHSPFCLLLNSMQKKECDILCISFVTTVQPHGSTFCVSLAYLLTCLLWSQESTWWCLLSKYSPVSALNTWASERRSTLFMVFLGQVDVLFISVCSLTAHTLFWATLAGVWSFWNVIRCFICNNKRIPKLVVCPHLLGSGFPPVY